jgi:peroxiredoxin
MGTLAAILKEKYGMLEKKERTIVVLAILISAVMLIAVAIVVIVNRQGAEQPLAESGQPDYHEVSSEPPAEPAKPDTKPIGTYNKEPLSKVPAETIGEPATQPKPSLPDIIRKARTWGPAFNHWVGKPAPDFTLTDIAGKDHKLSDYRGKDVLIIFWATWCGPCLVEIPHLIALRNIIGEDKLVMLAISNENPAIVKKFVAAQRVKINYTVLSDPGSMPPPFNVINSIPCSFFIDPDGKIKLATVGTLSLSAIKDILKAEWPETNF